MVGGSGAAPAPGCLGRAAGQASNLNISTVIYLSTYLSVCLLSLSMYLCIYLSIYLHGFIRCL